MEATTAAGVIEGYARAVVDIGRAEGGADALTGELYAIARAIDGSVELHDTITDPRVPIERKQGVLVDVLDGRAAKTSISLVNMIVAAGRVSDLSAISRRATELAAEDEQLTIAEVRSAVDLDDETVARLEATLAEVTGKRIRASVVVDPTLLGGVVAKVGDIVFDGSVRSRLQDLREAWG